MNDRPMSARDQTPLSARDLPKLLAKLVDDALTDAEFQQLDITLRNDPEARRVYMQYVDLHEELAELVVPGMSSRGDRQRVFLTLPTWRIKHWQGSVAFLALTACLLAIVAWGGWKQPIHSETNTYAVIPDAGSLTPDTELNREVEADQPVSRPPAPIAMLTSQTNAIWNGTQLQMGQTLYVGDSIHLVQGQAGISVGYGAEIAAHAPCRLDFLAADQVRLSEGDIDVDVAEWAKGFAVITDTMTVVDLGTTFTVSNSGANAETTVVKGMVRAIPVKTRGGERRSLLLSEGERLSIDKLGNRSTSHQAVDERGRVLDFGGLTPFRPVELHNTGRGLAVGDQDPFWRVIAGPNSSLTNSEAGFAEPEFAQVCQPNARYLPNDPAESQWVSIQAWEDAAPNSVYTFQTTFNLEGYDRSTVRLFGRFLADNGIAAVRVNGHAARVESWADNVAWQEFGGPQFRFINVTDGMVEGANSIEVDVRNGNKVRLGHPKNIPNPMALRVEWYAFGRQTQFDVH